MSHSAIIVEGLSKEYRIGAAQRATTLRDQFATLLRRPFRHGDESGELIWALRDVSFDVERGEILGVCGQNGAGKSTLLKILSRVTEPTLGRAVLRGRVSSLLEVGTGFHGDLTGRENIFLNGALLGMKVRDVQAQLDAIVDFSGIGKFLDTPVRHYSSGMYARLGFAVAAHLDQDILILDEVLAVGDANFQRKCLDTVHEIAGRGKTVLLVSHNMAAVERFCSRAMLLKEGRIQACGSPQQIIDLYFADAETSVRDTVRQGDEILVHRVTVTTDAQLRGTIALTVELECFNAVEEFDCGLGIRNSVGHLLANASTRFQSLARGSHRLVIELANPGLAPGDYSIGFAAIRRQRWIKLFARAATFRVASTVTDEPFLLEKRDSAGIALEVRRTTILPPGAALPPA